MKVDVEYVSLPFSLPLYGHCGSVPHWASSIIRVWLPPAGRQSAQSYALFFFFFFRVCSGHFR